MMDVLLVLFDPVQVEAWLAWGGYVVLFGLLFACGLGLPLPEDVPLLAAGYFIATGDMDLVVAGTLAWLGIIGGDCVLYSFGRRYGLNITRVPFVGKHVTQDRILKAEDLFERYGVWVVGIGRMVAGIRGAMVVAAGAIRFNFVKFVIVDGIAALFSGGLFVALGYWAGRKLGSIEEMRQRIEGVEHYVFGGLALAAVGAILYLWYRRRRHKPPVTDALADAALTKVVRTVHAHDTRPNSHAPRPLPPDD